VRATATARGSLPASTASATSSATSSARRWGPGSRGSASSTTSPNRSPSAANDISVSAAAGAATRIRNARSRASSIPARQRVVFPTPASPLRRSARYPPVTPSNIAPTTASSSSRPITPSRATMLRAIVGEWSVLPTACSSELPPDAACVPSRNRRGVSDDLRQTPPWMWLRQSRQALRPLSEWTSTERPSWRVHRHRSWVGSSLGLADAARECLRVAKRSHVRRPAACLLRRRPRRALGAA
jgi:hypothetical protein